MKKSIGIMLALTFTFTLGTISVFAAQGNCGGLDACAEICRFVDENNDGICDYYLDDSRCPQDGTGRRGGKGRFAGSRFVDSNGDGSCDNYESGVCGRR